MDKRQAEQIAEHLLEDPRARQRAQQNRNRHRWRLAERLIASICAIIGFWIVSMLALRIGVPEPAHWACGAVGGVLTGMFWPPAQARLPRT